MRELRDNISMGSSHPTVMQFLFDENTMNSGLIKSTTIELIAI